MIASTRLLVAFVCAIAAGGVVLMIGQAFTPQRPRRQARRRFPIDTTWVTAAVIVFVVVLAITRWPIAAIGAGALVAGWPALFPSDAIGQRQRLEGIAKWLEDLRDLVLCERCGLLWNRAFDEELGREARRRKIRVIDACPPHTETGLATRANGSASS